MTLYLVALTSLLALATSCSEKKGEPSDEAPTPVATTDIDSVLGAAVAPVDRRLVIDDAETIVDVEWSKATTLVAGDAVAALKNSDDTAHRYTFDKEKATERGLVLEKGRVLLIAGRALRRIESVKDAGDTLEVSTSYASLNEAIENGRLRADVTLPLTQTHVTAMVFPDGREVPIQTRDGWMYASNGATPAGPQAKLDWSLKDGDTTYKAKLVPNQNKIDVEVQVTRQMKPTGNLLYTAKGTIQPIKAVADATFVDGKTTEFEYGQDDIGGVFEVSMTAAGGGKLEISKEVPALKLKWIVMVGPVPLVITSSMKLIGRVNLPAKGSSVAKATFEFTGKGGMRKVGQSVEAEVGFKKEKFKAKPFDSAGFIGENVDTQFGVAFPVISAGFFDSFFMPQFFTGFTIGSRLYWGPVCKNGYLRVTAHYAHDFKVLGLNLVSDKKLLYKKQKFADQDGCLKKHGGKGDSE